MRGFLTTGRRLRARSGLADDDARDLAARLEALGAVVAIEPPFAREPERTSYESGLAAARSTTAAPVDNEFLGALATGGGLTVSSLDGEVIDAHGADESLSKPISVPVQTVPPARPRPVTPAPSGPPSRPVTPPRASTPAPPQTPKIEYRPAQKVASGPTVPTQISKPAPENPFAPPSSNEKPVAAAPTPTTRPPSGPIVKPTTPPAADPFAPPPDKAPAEIELAYPEPRRPTASGPQAMVALGSGPHAAAAGASGRLPAAAPPVIAPESAPAAAAPAAKRPTSPLKILSDRRARFGVALLAGLLLGFLFAHLYASGAEDRLDEIRLEVLREPAPQTQEEHQLAVERHEVARARMERVKSRIVLTAGFIWLLVGGGVAFGVWKFMPTRWA